MKLYSLEEAYNLEVDEVKKLYKQSVSSAQVKLLSSFSFGNDLSETSEGCYIYTKKGKKILDFTGGFGVLNHGHNNKRILEARIDFQKRNKVEVHKNFLCPYLAVLSHNISQVLPGDLNVSYLPNSGAEANEGAIKLAYKFHDGKRKHILHSDISFHGKLLGTGSLTSSPEIKFKFPGLENKDDFIWNNIESLNQKIKKYEKIDGESDIFAIIIEPFSASSLKECSKEFLFELRKICTEKKIVLIFDEIYTGWGKTGEFFYFMKYKDLVPDVLTMSKSFGGGKSSISCFVTTRSIFEKAYGNIEDSMIHSTTYNAFGEECATAIEAVNIAVEEDYPLKASKIGNTIKKKLEDLKLKYPSQIKEIRGKGCLQGIIFNNGPKIISDILKLIPINLTNDERFLGKLIASSVISSLYDDHNILTALGQNKEICLWISPPIIASEDEVDYFLKSLESVLSKGITTSLLSFVKKQVFFKSK
jgi:putrescine aminotransferase